MLEQVERPTLAELFANHHRHLVRLAMVLTGDRELAADLTQDAFVRLGVRPMWRWPAPGAELGYLRRTVINLAHSHHRHLRIVRRTPPETPEPVVDPSAVALRRDDDEQLLQKIRRLPPRQQACVALRYFADLSQAEIAEVLGISPGSVKSHLHRARTTLAEILEASR